MLNRRNGSNCRCCIRTWQMLTISHGEAIKVDACFLDRASKGYMTSPVFSSRFAFLLLTYLPTWLLELLDRSRKCGVASHHRCNCAIIVACEFSIPAKQRSTGKLQTIVRIPDIWYHLIFQERLGNIYIYIGMYFGPVPKNRL